MDIFDAFDDELDDFFDRLMEPRREPIFRQRSNHMEILDDVEFRVLCRFNKDTVYYIHSLIEDKVSFVTERNYAISSMDRLLLTLQYYATGSFLNVVGDFTGVSKAPACRILNVVSLAIAPFRTHFVKFPEDVAELRGDFYEIAKFPRLIGAIDCTHVPIKSPGGDNAESYPNRKSQFPLYVQTIINNSFIKQRFLNREFGNCVIVGDKGYENTFYLLTPLQNPVTPAEHLYNESQIRSRNVVERSYGVWKNRFPILAKKIILHLSRVQSVIVACALLYNIAKI